MTIVMGLDQHRAQITAEWIDTETGEVSRTRISPAHRAGVRRFFERFRGQELEVGLEATTGWRFVAEELRRVGAAVHLAEPAETADRLPLCVRERSGSRELAGSFGDDTGAAPSSLTPLVEVRLRRSRESTTHSRPHAGPSFDWIRYESVIAELSQAPLDQLGHRFDEPTWYRTGT
jgi:hypothetical protein